MFQNRRERLKSLINAIRIEGSTTIEKLAEKFNVSTATIRRDVKLLEGSNQIIHTVSGGIVYNKDYAGPSKIEAFKENIDDKLRIAEFCTSLINEHNTIAIGQGVITFLVGKIISGITDINFRVITNSLELAIELSDIDNIKTVIVGGEVENRYSMGYDDESDFFKNIKFIDILFFTADGIDLDYGITYFSGSGLKVIRQMIQVSKKIVLISDSSKFGKICFNYLTDIENVSMVITDTKLDKDLQKSITKRGVDIIIV